MPLSTDKTNIILISLGCIWYVHERTETHHACRESNFTHVHAQRVLACTHRELACTTNISTVLEWIFLKLHILLSDNKTKTIKTIQSHLIHACTHREVQRAHTESQRAQPISPLFLNGFCSNYISCLVTTKLPQ